MPNRSTNSRMCLALFAAWTVGAGTTWSCISTTLSGSLMRRMSGDMKSKCTVVSTSTITTSPGRTVCCSEWLERIFSIAFIPMKESSRSLRRRARTWTEERRQLGDVVSALQLPRSLVQLARLVVPEHPGRHVHELGLELVLGQRVRGIPLRVQDLVGELAAVRRAHRDAPGHAVRHLPEEILVLVHDRAGDHLLHHGVGDRLLRELVDGDPAVD